MRRGAASARLLFAALLLSVLPFAVPAYLDRLRLTRALAPEPVEKRKELLFGAWYAEAAALDRTLPRDHAVDFVLAKPSARDIAVLAGAVLQPRDVRFFDGWEAWRERRRAEFFHDRRAANAAPGPPPSTAPSVILVDADASPHLLLAGTPR